MAFRTVVIGNDARIRVHSRQLLVEQDETLAIPAEDIAVLVLEHPRIRVSCASLSLLTSQGVAVVTCDDEHMPTGILLPYCQHSRQLSAVRKQLAASKPLKKRLWQRIVRSKIENQALCLEDLERDGASRLREYKSAVTSGDTTHVEAAAARYYFPRLMPGITRHSGQGPDAALDYGYAIVRAAIARYLVGYGLYPPFGIHHDGQLNAFNLADDLLEPFRPMVDRRVITDGIDASTIEGRRELVALLHEPCMLVGQLRTVLTAIDSAAQSVVRALYRKDDAQLLLPVLVDATTHARDRMVE